MAKAVKTGKPKSKAPPKKTPKAKPRLLVRFRWFVLRGLYILSACALLIIVALNIINPPTTYYMQKESQRLGGVKQEWVAFEDIAPIMARAVVAAEDANFCAHWGFDVQAIKAAIAAGGTRGASTITQQTVKNVFLWHGRSYIRKVLEAGLTPVIELFWSKRRILEIYLNVAEFDEGVFGVKAAAQHYFGVRPSALSNVQAARLAAILPSPKTRSPLRPTQSVRRRAAQILNGAATIRADKRSACFES